MRKVAIIPARGGSTRLKDKNIQLLGDKPLIRWIVLTVLESNQFDDIYISTDSDKIFDCVKDLPVKRHHRPEHLATVKATVLDAVLSFMDEVESYDIIAYFLPTCPFMKSKYIIEGIKKLEKFDSVVSVSKYSEPIQLACTTKGDYLIPIFDNLSNNLTNSKFIQTYVKPNGGFYMSKWEHLKKERNVFKGDISFVQVPSEDLVDIDYAEDLLIANLKLDIQSRK